MDSISLYLLALKIGVSAMVALWVASLGRRDASLVDLWWGPGFAVGAAVVWLLAGAPAGGAQLAVLALVLAWSVRLSRTMLGRRKRHPGEDPRYAALRRSRDPGFWWKSLFMVFLLQAVLQWLIALAPLSSVLALAGAAALGPLAALGALVALGGLALETVADAQLDAHKAAGREGVCDTGLRAAVRYPNYLGEIVFWWGLWLIAASTGAWWTVVSPALVTLLLWKVSGAPILDERLAGRPGWEAWRARTPAFLPRPLLRLVGRAPDAPAGQER